VSATTAISGDLIVKLAGGLDIGPYLLDFLVVGHTRQEICRQIRQ
tara:strand:+ start:850 stop:984 length:135 start_codon:yes stop_codon:yes gene_type:complete